jgi:hypothetical protein
VTSERLLTGPEAAHYAGIQPCTLRHWISDRKIDVVKYRRRRARHFNEGFLMRLTSTGEYARIRALLNQIVPSGSAHR